MRHNWRKTMHKNSKEKYQTTLTMIVGKGRSRTQGEDRKRCSRVKVRTGRDGESLGERLMLRTADGGLYERQAKYAPAVCDFAGPQTTPENNGIASPLSTLVLKISILWGVDLLIIIYQFNPQLCSRIRGSVEDELAIILEIRRSASAAGEKKQPASRESRPGPRNSFLARLV